MTRRLDRMTGDSLQKLVAQARTLMVHVERHLDLAADEDDVTQLGRAWIRTVQLERLMAAALPPDVVADVDAELRSGAGETGPIGTPPDSAETSGA
jgi:hypothetical protein